MISATAGRWAGMGHYATMTMNSYRALDAEGRLIIHPPFSAPPFQYISFRICFNCTVAKLSFRRCRCKHGRKA